MFIVASIARNRHTSASTLEAAVGAPTNSIPPPIPSHDTDRKHHAKKTLQLSSSTPTPTLTRRIAPHTTPPSTALRHPAPSATTGIVDPVIRVSGTSFIVTVVLQWDCWFYEVLDENSGGGAVEHED